MELMGWFNTRPLVCGRPVFFKNVPLSKTFEALILDRKSHLSLKWFANRASPSFFGADQYNGYLLFEKTEPERAKKAANFCESFFKLLIGDNGSKVGIGIPTVFYSHEKTTNLRVIVLLHIVFWQDLFEDPTIVKVFHGSDEDLKIITNQG